MELEERVLEQFLILYLDRIGRLPFFMWELRYLQETSLLHYMPNRPREQKVLLLMINFEKYASGISHDIQNLRHKIDFEAYVAGIDVEVTEHEDFVSSLGTEDRDELENAIVKLCSAISEDHMIVRCILQAWKSYEVFEKQEFLVSKVLGTMEFEMEDKRKKGKLDEATKMETALIHLRRFSQLLAQIRDQAQDAPALDMSTDGSHTGPADDGTDGSVNSEK